MKHFILLLSIATAITFAPRSAHAQDNPTVYVMGHKTDTVLNGTTLSQTLYVASQGAISIQAAGTHGTGPESGYLSLWSSIDGNDYVPVPGADSFQITSGNTIAHGWYVGIGNFFEKKVNPARYYQVRTRLTTKQGSVVYMRSRLYRIP